MCLILVLVNGGTMIYDSIRHIYYFLVYHLKIKEGGDRPRMDGLERLEVNYQMDTISTGLVIR